MTKKIELYIFLFSIFFFGVILFLFEEIFKNNFKNQFLLFVIPLLWPGIAHGSLDLYIAQRLKFIKSKKNLLMFSTLYLLVALSFLLLWFINSELSLFFFLLISIIHFGISDTLNKKNAKFYNFEIFLRGSIPIVLPTVFYEKTTDSIFSILSSENEFSKIVNEHIYVYFMILILFFLKDLFSKKSFKKNDYDQTLIEIFCIFVCFWSFEPLISFSLYFCFLHSIRHLNDEKNILKFSFLKLIKATLPLTFITSFTIVFIYYFLKDFEYAYVSSLFIILSCLTLPHMILVSFSKT